ncbi:MAG: leucine-rich repeat domain-containing protein [Holosporales bacterium]|nr:leucine-rich repeat domain-containing protein [Holosporales bacterium]
MRSRGLYMSCLRVICWMVNNFATIKFFFAKFVKNVAKRFFKLAMLPVFCFLCLCPAECSDNVMVFFLTDGRRVECPVGTEVNDISIAPGLRASVVRVHIPSNVIILGARFTGFTNLESVDIEEGSNLEVIGKGVFKGCKQLSSITLENAPNLQTIRDTAFSHCSALREINIENVRTIGCGAFMCSALEYVLLGPTVESIGNAAFATCHNLQNVTILAAPQHLGVTIFAQSGVQSIFYEGVFVDVFRHFFQRGRRNDCRIIFEEGENRRVFQYHNGALEEVPYLPDEPRNEEVPHDVVEPPVDPVAIPLQEPQNEEVQRWWFSTPWQVVTGGGIIVAGVAAWIIYRWDRQ